MSKVAITFLGHTTVLIKSEEISIITDPNFSDKTLSLKRKDQPIINPDALNSVNVITISNAHHNRLNTDSFKYFKQDVQMVLPIGLGKLVNTYFNFRLSELKEDAEKVIGSSKIIAKKSLHRGFRTSGLTFSNSLHYIFKLGDKTIFYCSDTKYDGTYFFELGKAYDIDLAILPIDHVGPDLTANGRYLNVSRAVQAFQDLNAKKMLPVSYGSFSFSGHSKESVEKKLLKEIEKHSLQDKIQIVEPGGDLTLD